MTRVAFLASVVLFLAAAMLNQPKPKAAVESDKVPPAPVQVGHPTFVSPHASPIAVCNELVFVVNTPADTVDVIEAKTRRLIARIAVGVDPVSIAVRPDRKEVWVSNHVSDSVSVIDTDSSSPTYLNVVATIQEFNERSKATEFDEPVGIAFASKDKAYVALSSSNQIAVVDVASRKVTKRLRIRSQDPRAITVRNGRLYVIPFESNNKTQLSGGTGKLDERYETFDAFEHSIRVNNVLSLGHVTHIVKHPDVPDRDLYVFDTKTDKLVETVDTLGTLLYGLTVDSSGKVYVAQTDARNDANGKSGTKKHGLKELENRAFLNQITAVSFDAARSEATQTDFIDLEPLPPEQPKEGEALATPFAIEVSEDDSTLFVSAAASDKLFTVDTKTGDVIGRVDVGAVPRGIALGSTDGKSAQAWVLNAVENSVSLVDVADAANPKVVETVALADPTHPQVKRGRIAFNAAHASTTGTFACASCHPDGHTDQLLWVLKTPIVSGGNQIMPRSTMPIRGLRDTAPYHWDGIPGDPYGGNNSANIHTSVQPNSDKNVATSTTRHLIDGGLASTMAMVGSEGENDEGKAGRLTARERDDMAMFLLGVPFPPAQKRAYTNELSDRAEEGFKLFHIEGDYDGKVRPNVCGDCHRMPFLVSTNTPGTGMDAPTWRGAYDRFLILPQGRLNIIDFDFYRRVAEQGQDERSIWQFSWAGRRRFNPIWEMVLEGSTGYSGSFARQVGINRGTAESPMTKALMAALQESAAEGAVVLEADGVVLNGSDSTPVNLQFAAEYEGGSYVQKDGERRAFGQGELLAMAAEGNFVGTLTARHGAKDDVVEHPQPALWTLGPIQSQRGRQKFPVLYPGNHKMTISGRHVDDATHVVVNGRRVDGSVSVVDRDKDKVEIQLAELPKPGLNLVQVQNASGLFSNDFIFHVVKDAEEAAALNRGLDRDRRDVRNALADAIARNDIEDAKRVLHMAAHRRINEHAPRSGSTPLSHAALHGRKEMMEFLIRRGGNVKATNRDGNTPLHVAAFLCRGDIVKFLLEKGCSPTRKNRRGETPIDVVSGEWDKGLADFYQGLGQATGIEVDLDDIQKQRPRIAELLRKHAGNAKQDAIGE